MRPAIAIGAAAAIFAAAGAGLMVNGLRWRPTISDLASVARAADANPPIYFQDPDGKPLYSPTPRKTPDGRDWRPVPAGGDVNFNDDTEAEKSAPAAAEPARKIKYYRNPMGLPDTSPVPKKDSMGMDYVPVYDGEDSDDGSVKLSPGKIQRTGARSEPVTRRAIRSIIRAPGTIQLDERRVSVVALRFEGFVDAVANVTTGDHVHKGQPLMNVYSPAVSSAGAEYLSALGAGTSGQPLKGARRRLENLGVPEAAIAEIERTREVSLSIPWAAPQDGEILERNAVSGMRAAPGAVMFRIADHGIVWAVLDVAERDLSRIAIGERTEIKPRALASRSFVGTVALIYPHLNPQTRTARVRVELPNPDQFLRPEMYVDAEIDTGTAAAELSVPETAVLDSGSRQVVLVDKGDGRFEPRDVKLGRRGGGYVEVSDGLREGESVVVSANFLIDAESNMKAALRGYSLPGEQK
jgi:Cu(I)/Ag(I) efflux system membrane fusion protein